MKGKEVCNQRTESRQDRNHEEVLSSCYLDVHTIASYLAIKASTLYSMVEKKKVPHYRIGRQIRFRKSEIDEWMASQKEEVVNRAVEPKRVGMFLQKNSTLAIDRIVKKAIDGTKGKRYNLANGKPDQSKGLGKEVSDGTV